MRFLQNGRGSCERDIQPLTEIGRTLKIHVRHSVTFLPFRLITAESVSAAFGNVTISDNLWAPLSRFWGQACNTQILNPKLHQSTSFLVLVHIRVHSTTL